MVDTRSFAFEWRWLHQCLRTFRQGNVHHCRHCCARNRLGKLPNCTTALDGRNTESLISASEEDCSENGNSTLITIIVISAWVKEVPLWRGVDGRARVGEAQKVDTVEARTPPVPSTIVRCRELMEIPDTLSSAA